MSRPRRRPDGNQATGLVIELCGLPGAGKTTLAQALVTTLRADGRNAEVVDDVVSAAVPRARRLPRKVVMTGQAAVQDPRATRQATRLLAAGQDGIRDRVSMPVQWMLASRLLEDARRSQATAVVEEGLVQALWSARLRSTIAIPELVALASNRARADVVVHLELPVELALDRLRRRASRHSRVQRLEATEQQVAMREGDALLRCLLSEWVAQGHGAVLTVDAGRRDAVDQLVSLVTAPVPSTARAP